MTIRLNRSSYLPQRLRIGTRRHTRRGELFGIAPLAVLVNVETLDLLALAKTEPNHTIREPKVYGISDSTCYCDDEISSHPNGD